MKKRVLFTLLASVTAAACLACGCEVTDDSLSIIDGETTAQTASLSIFGHRADRYSLSVIENTLQSFMSKYSDLTVTYESAPATNYWQALDRRNSSGKLDDVFMIDRDRLITMTDGLLDVSDAVDKSIFSNFARSQMPSGGAIYAVPTAVTTYGLYVNYDLLEKHGKQQAPKNLSEFTAVCDYFVKNGITPIVCNNDCSLRSLILARGLYDTYCTAGTESKIAQYNKAPTTLAEPLNEGIDFVYEMIASKWIDVEDAASTSNLSGDLLKFATGEYPFMITGGWVSTTLRQILEENGKSLYYDILPYHVKNDSSSVLVAQTDFICVKKDAGAQAKELLSLLVSPAALLNLSYGQSCFSPVEGANFIKDADSAIIPSATYLNGLNVVNGSDLNLKIPLDTYLTECVKMILNGKEKDEVKTHLLSLLEGASL